LIRLEQAPSNTQLEEWTRRFPDILVGGPIARAELPTEDQEDPFLTQLHGISLRFNRKSFARLREFIDTLNAATADATMTRGLDQA